MDSHQTTDLMDEGKTPIDEIQIVPVPAFHRVTPRERFALRVFDWTDDESDWGWRSVAYFPSWLDARLYARLEFPNAHCNSDEDEDSDEEDDDEDDGYDWRLPEG